MLCFTRGNRKSQRKSLARSMTALQYVLNSMPTLDNLKNFQWTPILGSIAAPRIFKENLLTNFGLTDVFVKAALEITKRAEQCIWLPHMFSWFFEIAQVYSHLAGCRVHRRQLQNEWVIITSQKHRKSSKFLCIKSSLQFAHNLHLFCRNSKISWYFSYRFFWNFTQ